MVAMATLASVAGTVAPGRGSSRAPAGLAARDMGSGMSAYAVASSWLSRARADMLFHMTTEQTITSSIDGGPGAPALRHSHERSPKGRLRAPLDAASSTAHAPARDPHTGRAGDRAELAVESATQFSSVLCAVDRTANGDAARRQAELLASPGGTVELLPLPQPTRRGLQALIDACDGHDLFAVGARAAALGAAQHAPIPTLIARRCPLGTKVTDRILVPVDGSPESREAVELAAQLAATHEGTISVLQTPARDAALQRALAASNRILLHATGATPRVLGQPVPRERAIPAAAVAVSASLVVLGSGSSEDAKNATARITSSVGCSVLVVPAVEQSLARIAQRLATS
jgi:nucleotide-binding universal stress UspA family protein